MPPPGAFARRLKSLRRGYLVLALAIAQGVLLAARLQGLPWNLAGLLASASLASGWIAYRLHAVVFRRAHGMDPDQGISEGLTSLLAGDALAAEGVFRDLAGRFPRDADCAFYVGLSLREQGNLPASRKALNTALRLDLGRKWSGEILKLLG